MYLFMLPVMALLAAGPKQEAELLLAQDPASVRAGELLENAIAANAADAEAHYLLSRWALVTRHYARAAEAAAQSARLSTGNSPALMQEWTIAALAKDQMNLPEEAYAAFRKALAFNRALPTFDAAAAYEFLKVLERDHLDVEAGEVVTLILQKVPQFGPAHLVHAKQLAAAQKVPEAVAEAEFALAHPDAGRAAERDAHYLLARLYARLKKHDLAEVHRKWLNSNP